MPLGTLTVLVRATTFVAPAAAAGPTGPVAPSSPRAPVLPRAPFAVRMSERVLAERSLGMIVPLRTSPERIELFLIWAEPIVVAA